VHGLIPVWGFFEPGVGKHGAAAFQSIALELVPEALGRQNRDEASQKRRPIRLKSTGLETGQEGWPGGREGLR
jgi:hypothetical protein